jgi:hypothetical protein
MVGKSISLALLCRPLSAMSITAIIKRGITFMLYGMKLSFSHLIYSTNQGFVFYKK